MDNKKMQENAEIHECKQCNFVSSKKSNYNIHLLTQKHSRITMDNKKMPENAEMYECKHCNFVSSNKINYNVHLLTPKHSRITMDNKKNTKNAGKNAEIYECKKCNFVSSKKSNYNIHLLTPKHLMKEINNNKNAEEYKCKCGKTYRYQSGLCKHKITCKLISCPNDQLSHSEISNTLTNELFIVAEDFPRNRETSTEAYVSLQNTRDDLITRLLQELTEERNKQNEMKSVFMLMMEKYQEMQLQNQKNTTDIIKEATKGNQELVNKMIEVMPKMGNVTNNTTNNTLNFYLTNTCKNAESIHDFTDRYVKRCSDFFIEHYRDIANNQMCLATNVYEIMFKCLEENPQYMNFIQTTDVKNGIHYVKEKKKDENRQLYGEAEFIKYIDGFEKAGASIGHALNKAIFPLQTEFTRKLEREIGVPPNESDFEDDDEYEDALDKYKIRRQDATRNLQLNVCNTMSLFDSKTRKMDILNKTRRVKEWVDKIDNI